MHDPKAVLAAYSIGRVGQVEPVEQGLVHETFFVDSSEGSYVFQRLAPGLSSMDVVADYVAVTDHLAKKGQPSPVVIRTLDDHPLAFDDADEKRRYWRLTTRLPGETRTAVRNAHDVEEAARALGRFHVAMADFDAPFRSAHPGHDTALHLERFRTSAANPVHEAHLPLVADTLAAVEQELPGLLLSSHLPRHVVHGDPKISNVLFLGDEALALIDLDTCNRHSVLVDLGDAVRSWCRTGEEDEATEFELGRFEAFLRGYAAQGVALTEAERASLADCGRLITWELVARFARDVLEDDYFGWDVERYETRRAHNLARTEGMAFLAKDMSAKRAEAAELVRAYFR